MPRRTATARKPEPDLAPRKYLCRNCVAPIGPHANMGFPLRGVCQNCNTVTDVAVVVIHPQRQPTLPLTGGRVHSVDRER